MYRVLPLGEKLAAHFSKPAKLFSARKRRIETKVIIARRSAYYAAVHVLRTAFCLSVCLSVYVLTRERNVPQSHKAENSQECYSLYI